MALKFFVYLKFLKKNPLQGYSTLQELYQDKAMVHDKTFVFTEHSLSIQIILVSYNRFGNLISEGPSVS